MSNAVSPEQEPDFALWIPLTDHAGKLLVESEDMEEPAKGSIILTNGMHGTAWQRLFADGLWHSTVPGANALGRTWISLVAGSRSVILVYDAPVRGDQP